MIEILFRLKSLLILSDGLIKSLVLLPQPRDQLMMSSKKSLILLEARPRSLMINIFTQES